MPTTKVKDAIDRCKRTLQEVTSGGTRWKNEELVVWLSEFYQFAAGVSPGEFSVMRSFSCVAGTKQDAPEDIVQVLDVTRNLDGQLTSIIATTKNVMDSTRRNWHGETQSITQEVFILDERYPRQFYVWPPAAADSKIEIVGVVVPVAHSIGDYDGDEKAIKCSDRLVPAMVDYVLYRAYSKDAEFAGNKARADSHYNACIQLLQAGRDARYQMTPVPAGNA